ncbi:transposase, partial [Thermodesulfobacteriota bacterium]
MHHKNIKAIVKKQLKSKYRNWSHLPKKEKRRIAKMVLDEVVKGYDFDQEIKTSEPELLGIESQLPMPGIMNLDEMAHFIDSHENDVLFKLKKHKRHPSYLKDEELRFIDDILDDEI